MVRAVVPELHLHGLRARGETHELVAQADAEHRQPRRVENLADRLDGVIAGFGVARTVREKYAIGLHPQDLACGRPCRDYSNARATVDQHAQDVVLDAVVACYDPGAAIAFALVALAEMPMPFAPFIGPLGGHDLG